MADVAAQPQTIHYSQSAATANSWFVDEYYLGNPGNYKTYFVGINDACGYEFLDEALAFMSDDYWDKAFDPFDVAVSAFRERAVANTYGESGPFLDEAARDAFQIGADRILTRTAPPHPDDDTPAPSRSPQTPEPGT
jgi:hypothetical protein